MRSRNTHVRSKVAALLLSLVALWAFAAYVTVREGLNLLWVNVTFDDIGLPLDDMVQALDNERRLSVLRVAGDPTAPSQLELARAETDRTIAELLRRSSSDAVDWAASDGTKQSLAGLRVQLGTIGDVRILVDQRLNDVLSTVAPFNKIIDSAFLTNRSLARFDDLEVASQARAVVDVVYAREVLRREDALISGALTTGTMTGPMRAEFGRYVGMRRFLHTEAQADLGGDAKTALIAMRSGSQYIQMEALEEAVMSATDGVGVTQGAWRNVIDPMDSSLREFELKATESALKTAEPAAIGTIVRLVLAGLLGLAAVIASIVISITTARNLVRQLERLRNAARDLASYRLPRVVERLQQGEQVDVAQEAPPLDFGRDEIGQVGQAFNQVQETAIRVAVEQAELRRSIRDVFLSLARRSQALLHRQLGLLDAMERRTTDAEELAELFRIDHLATRMRRNAENLIVLSGATAGRAWRKPVPMVDVLRGALAEVEDYTRVTVLPTGNASLLGRAVGDVIHLLAELIENAVSFSPPQTTVRVGGSVVGYGFAIEIEDRGLGMSPEELAAANEQLRDPPEFRLTSTARLGLYVVGTLAKRHGIRVRLTESPYGGTTAVVLLPGSIMAEEGTDSTRVDPTQLDSYRPAQLAGGGRHRLQTDADRPRPAGTAAAVAVDVAGRSRNGATPTTASTNGARASTADARAATTVGPAGIGEAGDVAPAAGEETARRPAPSQPKLTPSGLPWRQRGGDRAQADRDSPTVALPAPGSAGAPAAGRPGGDERDPDAARSKLASFRSGTLRGRSDAARITGEAGAETAPTSPTGAAPADASGAGPAGSEATARLTPQWTPSTPDSAPPGPERTTPAQPWTAAADSPPRTPGSTTAAEHDYGQHQAPPWTTSTPEMRKTEEGG